MIFLWN